MHLPPTHDLTEALPLLLDRLPVELLRRIWVQRRLMWSLLHSCVKFLQRPIPFSVHRATSCCILEEEGACLVKQRASLRLHEAAKLTFGHIQQLQVLVRLGNCCLHTLSDVIIFSLRL